MSTPEEKSKDLTHQEKVFKGNGHIPVPGSLNSSGDGLGTSVPTPAVNDCALKCNTVSSSATSGHGQGPSGAIQDIALVISAQVGGSPIVSMQMQTPDPGLSDHPGWSSTSLNGDIIVHEADDENEGNAHAEDTDNMLIVDLSEEEKLEVMNGFPPSRRFGRDEDGR